MFEVVHVREVAVDARTEPLDYLEGGGWKDDAGIKFKTGRHRKGGG
jgi:hypothetical protein